MEINELLQLGVEKGASDIHLTVGLPPVFRMDGELKKLEGEDPLSNEETQKLAYDLMSQSQKDIFENLGEVDFAYSVPELSRFRVDVYRQRGSISLTLRPVSLEVPTIEALGLPGVLKDIANLKRGLVLVTGPKGSGKSTTLAAMINHINQTQEVHILTIEDPIEYLHKHDLGMVNQRELGIDTNNYSNALKTALKQDPDVIMIDEMNDIETISAAINAAEKGHLVLTTLHTMGAVATVDRIIEVFPKEAQQKIRIQLSTVLQGVISQQLVKKADGNGRIPAIEIMVCNPAIRNHIREDKTYQIVNSIQTSKKEGMFSMDAYLVELYKTNQITYEESLSHCVDRDWIIKML